MATRAESLHVPSFVRRFNPLLTAMLARGVPLGPNAVITVRGRKTGMPRTTGVAVVALDGRRWLIGTFGDVNWVRNLRAAGKATLTIKGRNEEVKAVELPRATAVDFFRDRLGPYVRRLPVGPLLLRILGGREILEDPAAAAEHRPVFELLPAA